MRWQFEKVWTTDKKDFVQFRNSDIQIEAYGIVRIKVDTPEDRRHITLTNLALVHGLLANIVSIQLITKLEFHWSSRPPTNLECNDIFVAYYLYPNGGLNLFNNPDSILLYVVFSVKLRYSPELRTITKGPFYRILDHPNSETLRKLNGHQHGIKIVKLNTILVWIKYTTYSFAKSKQIIFRQVNPEIPRSGLPFTLFALMLSLWKKLTTTIDTWVIFTALIVILASLFCAIQERNLKLQLGLFSN